MTSPRGRQPVQPPMEHSVLFSVENARQALKKKSREHPILRAVFLGEEDALARVFKEVEVDLNSIKDKEGFKPIHYAVLLENSAILKLLIKHGASVNSPVITSLHRGWSCLHMAAQLKNVEICQILLDSGGLGNKRISTFVRNATKPGFTQGYCGACPIHMAILSESLEIVKFFASREISLNTRTNSGFTPLHWAAMTSSQEIVRYLIRNGAEVNKTSNLVSPLTALHVSCFFGTFAAAKTLIKEGADIHKQNTWNLRQPLHMAVIYNHQKIVAELLRAGADINCQCKAGKTPLMYCTEKKEDTTIAKYLIKKHCDINAQDNKGYTALHWACEENNEAVLDVLLAAKPDLNRPSGETGKRNLLTPLALAVEYGTKSLCEKLLAAGADPNQTYVAQREITCAHLAAELNKVDILECLHRHRAKLNFQTDTGATPLQFALIFGKVAAAEWLIRHGANIHLKTNYTNKSDQTSLHLAAEKGFTDIVDLLMEFGANVNAGMVYSDVTGLTPLHVACLNDQTEMVKKLLNHGADKNAKRSDMFTALMTSVSKKNVFGIKNLIRSGADVMSNVSVSRSTGSTCLHLASQQGGIDAVRWLTQGGALVNAEMSTSNRNGIVPFFLAAENNFMDILQFFISSGNHIAQSEDCGLSVLHYAVFKGSTIAVRYLVDMGCDVNATANYDDREDMTTLHIACEKGWLEIVDILIENGADLNARATRFGRKGVAPIYIATISNLVAIIKRLAMVGADVTAQDERGVSPLHIAVQRGYKDVFQILMNYGCDMNAVTTQGLAAIHLAAEKGFIEVARTLVNSGCKTDLPCSMEDKFTHVMSHDITALHQACGFGHEDVIKILLQAGANPNACEIFEDREGITPLHCAALRGRTSVIQILMDMNKVDINAYDAAGYTPLHWSVSKNFLDTTRKVLEFQPDPTIRTEAGKTAWDLATTVELDTLLLKYQSKWCEEHKITEAMSDDFDRKT